jgi:hypothetical protein
MAAKSSNESSAQLERAANFAGRFAYALASVARTFTVGIASPQRRFVIARLAREAGYRDRPEPRLPIVAVDAITSPLTPVVLPIPETSEGSVTLLELTVLARLVRERQPARIFEIGTFDGRTTCALAANAPEASHTYTLDLPPGEATQFDVESKERRFIDKPMSGRLFREQPFSARITQLHGDSGTFDFSRYTASFVFVDGSHAYDYVINDSEHALGLLAGAGGVIVWHDYGEWHGVTRALDKLHLTDSRFANLRRVRGTSLAILSASS